MQIRLIWTVDSERADDSPTTRKPQVTRSGLIRPISNV